MAEDGTVYLHCDWRVNAQLRFLCDDIFGRNNFLNEIIWTYFAFKRKTSKKFPQKHDYLFSYKKNSDNFTWNTQFKPHSEDYLKRWKKDESGRLYRDDVNPTKGGTRIIYLDELEGDIVDSVWDDINPVNPMGKEKVDYPTQKPESLLERIIKASSNEGDLVADFFCGSGTTAAVAEKLNRKWITTDLGRFSIHTTRKRLINVQRELKENGNDFRAFEILNLGKYERQFFIDDLINGQRKRKEEAYLDLICRAYSAQRIENYATLHAKKASRFVHIGPLDMPVTQSRVQEIFEECRTNLITQVDVLGFEFEMGLQPRINQEFKEQGVDIRLRYIPKDVFDPRAVDKGQVKFYDVSYLQAKPIIKGNKVKIELTDFVTNYTQDDIEDIQESMRAGSKVVIENGQIIKVTKDKNGIINRETLTENWHDWIDYWSVDFDYNSKKEIIRIKNEAGEIEEKWTGNYIFENEWQTFRTKQDRTLEFISAEHEYTQKVTFRVMVKVVDILGVDTSQILEIKL
ncbi:DNA methyltransferase [Arenibacter sp. GZD96]|uniref:DNA methyltransferase n=1 Tax=Aurantibrevibacter litoralis TaxID=3106030 RepID=UPI002AFE695A|nr:DNA methyltransferase [Arenibacter sp. GZD-96]MEA1785314.1 DNA methyltransferase [Arenibacter sp. GZD-96]